MSAEELKDTREIHSKQIITAMVHLVIESIKKARYRLNNKLIKEYLNYFQVITPMKGGILGSNNLNKVLQEYFNPNPKKCVKRGELEFRLMDKVVHTKNENMTYKLHGRHDPCVAIRGSVVCESMMALILADMVLLNMSSKMENIKKVYT